MVIFLAIIGAAVCCGLCGYGLSKAVRRSRERRNPTARV
jgi:amino acid permease